MMSAQGIRLVIRRSDVYGSELMHVIQAMEGEFDKYAEKLGYTPRTGHLPATKQK